MGNRRLGCSVLTLSSLFYYDSMASVTKSLLGTETVRELRNRGVTATICGLSANDQERQFLSNGADAFLFKPLSSDDVELKREIMKVLEAGARNGREISDAAFVDPIVLDV